MSNLRCSIRSSLALLGSVLFPIALFSTGSASAQSISIETIAAPKVTQTYRLQGNSAAEIQIHGHFQIPKINPLQFRIISFEIDIQAIAAGLSWTSNTESPSYSAASRVFVSTSEDGNSIVNRDEFYSHISTEAGSYATASSVNGTFTKEQVGLDNLYGEGTAPLYFWLIGGGRVYSDQSGGAFGYVQVKTPVVRYTLEPISSNVEPVLDPGEGNDPSIFQVFSESQTGKRIHPSARTQLEEYLPQNLVDLSPNWLMNGRMFTGSFDTFHGYKYDILVGPTREDAEIHQTIEGTGTITTTTVDLTTRPEKKLFIWIRESRSMQ